MKLVIDIPEDVYKRTVFYREFRDLNDCVTTIKALENGKPLEQEPKIGHWIDMGSGQECSECREIQYGYDSFRYFCANCGAKMEG